MKKDRLKGALLEDERIDYAGRKGIGQSLTLICTAWWQKNSYPCMSFCMSFCLVGYEFFCHQAVLLRLRKIP